jgi:ankyrin repeat protein
VVKELLANGADANAKNNHGDTALFQGFNKLFVELIYFLIMRFSFILWPN